MSIQVFHQNMQEISAFQEAIQYWCNAMGELHHHGKYDITEDELPSELCRAYNDLWPLGYGSGSYCYLAETSKGFGVALVNEYDECFADECNITMDELFKSAFKDSKVISATSEFAAADIYVAEYGGFDESHVLTVVFPWDYPADKFKAAVSKLHDLAYQSAKELGDQLVVDTHCQSFTSRDWVESLDDIDRDCVEQYEFLLGRQLKDHSEYHEIDSHVDEMILEYETAEEFFGDYPELKKYIQAPHEKLPLGDQIQSAEFRVAAQCSGQEQEIKCLER